jgi:hypothetical protein
MFCTRPSTLSLNGLLRQSLPSAGDGGTNLIAVFRDFDALLDAVMAVCKADDVSKALDISIGHVRSVLQMRAFHLTLQNLAKALFEVINSLISEVSTGMGAAQVGSCCENPPIFMVNLAAHRCVGSILGLVCTVADTAFTE